MRIAVDGTYFGVLPALTTEPLIALAVACGADGLNWPFHPAFDMDNPAAVRQRLDEAGLAVVSIGLTSHTSATPGAEAEWREHVSRAAEAASILGTRILDCWPRRPPEVSKQEAQATLRRNIEAVRGSLAERRLTLALEFEPEHTLERYPEALEFVRPYYPEGSVTADSYHIFRIGDDLAAAGAALGAYAAILHISGSHRGEPGSEGDQCDYAAFVKAAIDAGYQGDLLLQYQPPGDAQESLRRAVNFVRQLL